MATEPAKQTSKARRSPRAWGNVEARNGYFRARYFGPDGKLYTVTDAAGKVLRFTTRTDANAALDKIQASISKETWVAPGTAAVSSPLLESYAADWMATRPLATRTQESYQSLLDNHVIPAFGQVHLGEITPAGVRSWYAREAKPVVKAHSYGLLKSILATAVSDGILTSNPCTIRGASVAKTTKKIEPLTTGELDALVTELPERYKALALLACWCSLRFGECAGLKRADVDLGKAVLHVRRGVVRTKAGLVEKVPKSAAGLRTVTIPSHVIPVLKTHLREHAEAGPDGYVFPAAGGGPLAASAFQRVFDRAAAAAGRPEVTPHVLRHTGQTYSALSGANLRELMARAGQSSPGAALRYLHQVDGRQREIADKLSEFAKGNVTPITAAGRTGKRRAPRRKVQ